MSYPSDPVEIRGGGADETVTGPLAPLFAQVREAQVVHKLCRIFPEGWDYETQGDYVLNEDGSMKHADDCPGCAHDAALSSIERHTQDMEKALERIEKIADEGPTWWDDPSAGVGAIARAALSAREKEEE